MKSKLIISLSLVSLLFVSCGWYTDFERDIYGVTDSETGGGDNSVTTPTPTVTNTIVVDGTTTNISTVTGILASGGSPTGEILQITLTNANATNPISVTMSVKDTSVAAKSYTYESQADAILTLTSTVYSASYGLNGYSTGEVTITAIDRTKKTVSGTYTFVGKNSAGESKNVSGVFSTTYISQ